MMLLSGSSRSSLLCFGRHKNSRSSGNMRILDVLTDHSEDNDAVDGSEIKRGAFDSSSRSLISRWLPKNSFKITKKRKKKADSGADADPDPCGLDPPASSGEVAVDPPSDSETRQSSEISVDSGRRHEDFSFNFGMGVGLVFLLAKSATEFNKMMELRAEMEMLLKEIKHEVRKKDAIASSSESNNISFSPSHCCGDINTSKTTSMPNFSGLFALQEAKCDVESDRESKYGTVANTRSLSMDKMETELQVELKRLQHNLEGEGSSVLEHKMEANCESDDRSSEGYIVNCEEENVLKDDNHEYNGVSAHELERKLHELLETRQQEKIAELESALACAEQTLREKEMELQWCKESQWVSSLNIEKTFI